eukprot:s5605_g2.t1
MQSFSHHDAMLYTEPFRRSWSTPIIKPGPRCTASEPREPRLRQMPLPGSTPRGSDARRWPSFWWPRKAGLPDEVHEARWSCSYGRESPSGVHPLPSKMADDEVRHELERLQRPPETAPCIRPHGLCEALLGMIGLQCCRHWVSDRNRGGTFGQMGREVTS